MALPSTYTQNLATSQDRHHCHPGLNPFVSHLDYFKNSLTGLTSVLAFLQSIKKKKKNSNTSFKNLGQTKLVFNSSHVMQNKGKALLMTYKVFMIWPPNN